MDTDREEPLVTNTSTTLNLKANTNIRRLALSKSICRFELPMDMRKFEVMTPSAYLEKYCKVNDRKIFDKYKVKTESKDEYLDLKRFEECIIEVHSKRTEDTIDLPEYQKDRVETPDFITLNVKLDGVKIDEKMLILLKSL